MPSQIDEEAIQKKGLTSQPINLHNPPLKQIPHQEYPKTLYLWPKDKSLPPGIRSAIAKDANEEKALVAKGWRTEPHKQELPEEVPDGFEPDIPKTPASTKGK